MKWQLIPAPWTVRNADTVGEAYLADYQRVLDWLELRPPGSKARFGLLARDAAAGRIACPVSDRVLGDPEPRG